jgi:hypothetical protein
MAKRRHGEVVVRVRELVKMENFKDLFLKFQRFVCRFILRAHAMSKISIDSFPSTAQKINSYGLSPSKSFKSHFLFANSIEKEIFFFDFGSSIFYPNFYKYYNSSVQNLSRSIMILVSQKVHFFVGHIQSSYTLCLLSEVVLLSESGTGWYMQGKITEENI